MVPRRKQSRMDLDLDAFIEGAATAERKFSESLKPKTQTPMSSSGSHQESLGSTESLNEGDCETPVGPRLLQFSPLRSAVYMLLRELQYKYHCDLRRAALFLFQAFAHRRSYGVLVC